MSRSVIFLLRHSACEDVAHSLWKKGDYTVDHGSNVTISRRIPEHIELTCVIINHLTVFCPDCDGIAKRESINSIMSNPGIGQIMRGAISGCLLGEEISAKKPQTGREGKGQVLMIG